MTEGSKTPQVESSWLEHLQAEFEKPYMAQLRAFLLEEKRQGKVIYPRADQWFAALNTTSLPGTRVVILGQDPYHGPGQAHGLCFSVQPGVRVPPSLQNIYKELANDLGCQAPNHGYLKTWAEQGVLLLNATLTVEQGRAASHQGKGWEIFTDAVVEILNREREHLVFLLWGSSAQRKGASIDRKKHRVLTAPHPSPLSAHRGFLGCRHFSQANTYLVENGYEPINWQLPNLD